MSTITPERSILQAYQQDSSDVLRTLGTSEQGLSLSEVQIRLAEHGPNQLAEEPPVSRWKLLLHQFVNPLVYILLIAAAVTAFLGEYKDTVVILVAVAIRTVIGYTQELKAEGSVRALKKMSVLKARVVRDGREREVNSEDLVPGDMVLLASGVKVPADLRLIRTTELRIDEAVLTGESVAADKEPAAIAEANLYDGVQAYEVTGSGYSPEGRIESSGHMITQEQQEGILSRLLVQRTIIVGLLIAAGVMYEFKAVLDAGMSLDKARTVAMTTMVFFQFFQTWNSRSETRSILGINPLSNRLLFFAMIAAFIAQIAVVSLPALQWVFRTEPFTASEWVRVALISSTVLIVVEVDKMLRRRGAHA